MKILKLFKKLDKQNGQSLVEFAIVIPVLLVLILGMVEYGWILNAKINLTSAAREGIRTAIVSTDNRSTNAFNAASNAVSGVSGLTLINNAQYYKYYEVLDEANNIRNAVVEIKGKVTPLVGIFVDNPYVIESKAVMRIE